MSAIHKVVIVGNNYAGWMTALAIKAKWSDCDIQVIPTTCDHKSSRSHEIVSTLPSINEYLHLLGLPEQFLLSQSQSEFNLATLYKNWKERDFYHGFGDYGVTHKVVDFNQGALFLKNSGETFDYQDFNLAAHMAQEGKFVHPVTDQNSILSTLQYGWRLDVEGLTQLLKNYGAQHGINLHAHPLLSINQNQQKVTAVELTNQSQVTGDLVVDCSFDAQVMGALGSEHQSLSAHLPKMKHIGWPNKQANNPLVTSLELIPYGWLSTFGAYQSVTVDPDIPNQDFTQLLPKPVAQELNKNTNAGSNLQEITPHVLDKFWVMNCVAIGPAATKFAAPSISKIDLCWAGLKHLISMRPCSGDTKLLAQEYQTLVAAEYQQAIDFTQLQFELAPVSKHKCWQKIKGLLKSDSLSYMLQIYEATGKIPNINKHLVSEDYYTSLMIGLGRWHKNLDPKAFMFTKDAYLNRHKQIKTAIEKTIQTLPDYQTYKQKFVHGQS